MRDDIYQSLRSEIVTGELSPGTPLREVMLAERFGVSRTPVRDALFRLEESGLAVRGQRGLEVRGINPESIIQVYDLRILLEQEAAGQAAENRTLSDLLTLEALIERDRANQDLTERVLIESNLEFHRAVWSAAANPVLVELMEKLTSNLVHAPTSTLAVEGRWEEALDEHERIRSAIEARDVEDARNAAKHHFSTARAIRLDLLKNMAAQAVRMESR